MRNLFSTSYDVDLIEFYKSISKSPVQIILSVLDILIVFFFLYQILKFSKGKRVFRVLKGVIALFILTILSSILNLHIMNAILSSIMTYGVLGLLIIFQPEIRRGLEKLGTQNKITNYFGLSTKNISGIKDNIYKVANAAEALSEKRVGALIVFEGDIKLTDIIENGIVLDSEVTVPLIQSIFEPNTSLHDGAIIISENRIKSASSILPLSDNPNISKSFGTRHRAALGLSEVTDAIIVIVSEETGKISIAKEGELIVDLNSEELKKILIKTLIKDDKKNSKDKNNKNNKDEANNKKED